MVYLPRKGTARRAVKPMSVKQIPIPFSTRGLPTISQMITGKSATVIP